MHRRACVFLLYYQSIKYTISRSPVGKYDDGDDVMLYLS